MPCAIPDSHTQDFVGTHPQAQAADQGAQGRVGTEQLNGAGTLLLRLVSPALTAPRISVGAEEAVGRGLPPLITCCSQLPEPTLAGCPTGQAFLCPSWGETTGCGLG